MVLPMKFWKLQSYMLDPLNESSAVLLEDSLGQMGHIATYGTKVGIGVVS